jgi:glycosyltransferase involved in cell wall biosynthesis
MDILLLNHYAGSARHGLEYRPFYLAREWIRAGHHVTIAASTQSHVRAVAPQSSGLVTEEWIDGIRYVWLVTPPYRGNGATRAANIFAFVAQLYLQGARLCRPARPELVIASSTYPLDIWPAWRIARRCGARLVHEVHDLWPLSPIELGGMSPGHPFIRLLQRAEDFACQNADKIVSILPLTGAHLEGRGMAPEKFSCIPNGIDVEEWTGTQASLPPTLESDLRAESAKGHFLVGYAGSHGSANALDNLLKAAALLRDAPVSIILVGHGPDKAALQAAAREQGLANVVFAPPVPKASIPTLLARMDALYIGWHRIPIYRFGINPNKLIDYMMSGRPIVHAVEAGNDPVKDCDCGLSVPPEDPAALAAAISTLRSLDPAIRSAMGARGRRYVEQNHDYRVLARRFLEAVS